MSDRRRLDPTITLGHVLQVVVILLGLVAAVLRLESRITAIETKIDPMYRWFTARNEDPVAKR